MVMMENQIKGKDRLVDELYKNAFITASGTQAKKNLNKDVYMLIKLKKQLYDIRDVMAQKD